MKLLLALNFIQLLCHTFWKSTGLCWHIFKSTDNILSFFRYIHKFPKECKEVINALSTRCRLESLTLAIGTVVTKNILFLRKTNNTDLEIIASLVATAFRLQSFNLQSWPMYPGLRTVNIMKVLRDNRKLQPLERLSLYYQNPERATWASLNAILPEPQEVQYLKPCFAE